MVLAIPILIVALGVGLFWFAASPTRLVYLLPVLLGFEYRLRLSIFSLDLSELCFFIASFVCLARVWDGKRIGALQKSNTERLFILLLAIFACPAICFEYNTTHAASVYRDLMMPFLFFIVFLHARIEKQQVQLLIKLACIFGLANAVLGIVQYATGNYFWFAGPDEAGWQAYKTGLAKLSGFGALLGVQDALPTGFYTGANNFACYLSLPLCLVTTLALFGGLPRRRRILCVIASAVMFLSLLFTMFRTGLLVFAASMMVVYLFLSRRRGLWRGATVSLLGGLIAVLFLTQGLFDWDQFGSFEGRQEMISDALALMKSHPELLLTGGHTDLYHMQSKQSQEIHNLALYSVVQFGLPATLLFFGFYIHFFHRALRAVKESDGLERSVLVAIVASLATNIFLYGSTTMLIDSVQTSTWLLFWAGTASYLMAYAPRKQSGYVPAFVPRAVAFPENGKLA